MNNKQAILQVGSRTVPVVGRLPLFESRVQAGFPSPADDYIEGELDLNDHLLKHRTATFCLRAAGLSMTGANIQPDDILVVDRSLPPVDGKIVVAEVDGGFTVKRLRLKGSEAWLVPENEEYEPIKLDEDGDVRVWGCVTWVLHKVW